MVSKGEVNRCGSRLRDYRSGVLPLADPEEIAAAERVVREFRAGFQYPMRKTTVGLRQFVQRESGSVIVAQRLKRLPQIIHKLVRMPETNLARMEDIGGCRAILANRDEVLRVLARIQKNAWNVKRVRDYAEQPKASGYRGVHVVIERDGHRVEIQLRTPGQQAWAEAVERTAGRFRLPLKDETGPEPVLRWLNLAAEGIAL